MLSKKCEHTLLRWMLMCLALGSFLLLYNEVDHRHPGGQLQYVDIKVKHVRYTLSMVALYKCDPRPLYSYHIALLMVVQICQLSPFLQLLLEHLCTISIESLA